MPAKTEKVEDLERGAAKAAEPTDIERDFNFLWNEARYAFNMAIMARCSVGAQLALGLRQEVVGQYMATDPTSKAPAALFHQANPIQVDDPEVLLSRWLVEYRKRTKATIALWKNHPQFREWIEQLRKRIEAWKMMPRIAQHQERLRIGPEESATIRNFQGKLLLALPERSELLPEVSVPSKVKVKAAEEDRSPKALADRFRSAEQYRCFMDLLRFHKIVDAGGDFLSGHGQKSRLFGAYEGASENPGAAFSSGPAPEIIATLNTAFPSLKISAARPQDLRGTKGHVAMREAFKRASFPSESSSVSSLLSKG